MGHDYTPSDIEQKWQDYWENDKTFKTSGDFSKPKYYILDMFPYPSGSGLHVGHPEGYTATDIVSRYKRMKGFNVLHPMGWDAFGLPAERAAMRENMHPAIITKRNIATFKKQIQSLGLSYDWDREICTSDPEYYKWTQAIFLKMHEKGLAYLADVPVNWCAAQGTVLANEEVVDGKYVETGDPVERRIMKQWMLKITDYAEQLLEGLDDLDWPQNVIDMQKNWIGKSVGADINFSIVGTDEKLTAFTTRPETVYGVTFCVLAPDHPLLEKIVADDQKDAVEAYCAKLRNLSDREKDAQAGKQKTGVKTGAFAYNPITKQEVPIWVADYVRLDYGSGAVMAVPGHDERDQEFAEVYGQPIIQVIDDNDNVINSELINGLPYQEARTKIIAELEKLGIGAARTTYKLRDWLFSRQRYWGEPFPIVYGENGDSIPLGMDQLPLELPEIEEYKPTADGQPPLGRAQEWVNQEYNGQKITREINTMPQWAGSCWYYLRYMDPKNTEEPFSKEVEKYWGQVDLYVGGLEHAIGHLLYSRFWHKVMFDCGMVSNKEPFKKLFNQGMILGVSYRDEAGKYYHVDDVIDKGGDFFSKEGDKKINSMVEKMSKSKLNVVNPDDVVAEFGADALRLYEMFMGPLETTKPWQTNGVKGVYNFLQRVWRMSVNVETGALSSFISKNAETTADPKLIKELNITIAKVTEDIENLKFNTAIAKMMEFINVCKTVDNVPHSIWEKFILVLSPFAPHLAEEIWHKLGHSQTLAYYEWPVFDPSYMVEDTVDIVLCINGKKANVIKANKGLSEEEGKALLLGDDKVKARLEGKQLIKTVFVKDKLINAIVK